jgi:4-hydroxy-tetrahydrodipicolinate synthase
MSNYPRVLTAIVTPFTYDDKVDLNSMIELIRYQLINKCGIVLFGTTGECPTITNDERHDIYKQIILHFSNDNDKFVVGVGGNNTSECIQQIKIASDYGFMYFMLTVPYYNKPTQIGLEKHFAHICNTFKDSKFILYNVPSRCGVNMLPNTVLQICNNAPNVIAIKEASGDLSQMIMIRRLCPELKLYCGDDGLIVPAMSIGSYGLISVVSNYCPRITDLIISRCIENNYSSAFELYSEIDDIVKLLFSETSPSPIKYLLQKEGLINTDEVRLPLVKMQSVDNKNKFELILNKFNSYKLSKFI